MGLLATISENEVEISKRLEKMAGARERSEEGDIFSYRVS